MSGKPAVSLRGDLSRTPSRFYEINNNCFNGPINLENRAIPPNATPRDEKTEEMEQCVMGVMRVLCAPWSTVLWVSAGCPTNVYELFDGCLTRIRWSKR